MEQLTFLEIVKPKYKYIIDTSAILSQKDNEPHRRRTYAKKWEYIDSFVQQKIIVTCSEIREEIKDEAIIKWLKDNNLIVLDIDDEIQCNVKKVVTSNPQLIDFKQVKSSGDAFLIATAMKYSLTVITEENKDSSKKIPKVCEKLGVLCTNILGLCDLEKWTF